MTLTPIDRREAVRRVTAILGGTALIGGTALLNACAGDRGTATGGAGSFSATDIAFLDEVADTILPTTDTPGAKAAAVGAFMALMVTDTYKPEDQTIFRDGMAKLEKACQTLHGHGFMSASPDERVALLESLDKEQKTYQDDKAEDAPTHYFRMMKELTLVGYFTSEIGCTQAQRYAETPGRFDPCQPYTGERAMADHA
jgi:hypothetical protein